MPSAEQERAGFSLRLCKTLSDAGWTKLSPTRLATEFNWLAGESGVSLHAARKWITGDAIPTQARVVLLANWLDISADWLRFGTKLALRPPTQFDSEDSLLLAGVSHLSEIQKQMARDMMKMLVRVGSK
jgi:transcriptional regulator with XRE-family HTH domain